MNQYHNLQMRFPASEVATGKSLFFRGERYMIGQPTPKTLQPSGLPMGVMMGGYTEQFSLMEGNQSVGAAWFYFYPSFEGKMWAVLDEVELMSVASCA